MEDSSEFKRIFTCDEALDYLVEQLGISDAADLLTQDPLALLDKLSSLCTEMVTFQNITILSSLIGTIDVPSLDQIQFDHLAGRGGMFYGHNRFCFELLCALGYKAHMASGQVTKPDDHLVVIVDAMPNGDSDTPYLVDNGFGFPHHAAISLNFDTKSPVYNVGHSIFTITREGELYSRWSAKQGKNSNVHLNMRKERTILNGRNHLPSVRHKAKSWITSKSWIMIQNRFWGVR